MAKPRRRRKTPRRQRGALAEQLEPRLLLSADLPGLPLDAALPQSHDPADVFEVVVRVSGRDDDRVSVSAEQHVSRHELVFVDPGVDDVATLVADLERSSGDARTFEVIVLDADRDGIAQISEILAGQVSGGVDAVHVVSHGSDEGVQLGDTWVGRESLAVHAESVAGWRSALRGDADLLFYGCNLAGSAEGRALVADVAALTGADVAASVDTTGAAVLGGDWELEHAVGAVDTSVAFSVELRAAWSGLLLPPTANPGAGLPYVIDEGDSITLDATLSTDPELEPLLYQWDLDDDGVFGELGEPSGPSPTALVTWSTLKDFGIDDDGVHPIRLRVTDPGALFDTTTTTITVNNTAPTITATGQASVNSNDVYSLDLTATDPGDDAIVGWTIDWGDGTIDRVGDVPSATHTYTQVGFTRNVAVSVTDDDGTWTNSELLVGQYEAGSDDVYRFDGATGAFVSLFDSSAGVVNRAYYAVTGPDGNVYVSGYNSSNVVRYDASGAYLGEFVPSGSNGLNRATGLAFGPDGNLYVASYGPDEILRFDPDGNFIDVFASGNQLRGPTGIAFGPDGDLYVAGWDTGRLVKIDGTAGGAPISLATGLGTPEQIVFDGAGLLYIATGSGGDVVRWDGAAITPYFDTPGLNFATGLSFGPDGLLYVGSHNNDRIYRFDGSTTETFLTAGSEGFDQPEYLSFTPDLQVLVSFPSDGSAIWSDANLVRPEINGFDGSVFGTPGVTSDVDGPWNLIAGAEAPTRDEKILVGVDSNGNVSGQLWDGVGWTPFAFNDIVVGLDKERWGFDVAYESQSGNAVLVYANGTSGANGLSYRVWNGATWSGPTPVATPIAGAAIDLKLAASPISNEMVLAVTNENDDPYVLGWNGSSWGDLAFVPGLVDARDIDVAYEQQSGHAMVVFGGLGNAAAYGVWNGAGWSSGIVAAPVLSGGEVLWTSLASDPTSDRIAFGAITNDKEIWLAVWDGTGWEASELAPTQAESNSYRTIAVAFESRTGEALAAYGTGQDQVYYQTWSSTLGWSGERIGPDLGIHAHGLTLDADPNSDAIMLSAVDHDKEVSFVLWDGASWGTPSQQEAEASANVGQPFLFLWDQSVNTAPFLNPAFPFLPSITEDDTNDAGVPVSVVLSGLISDPDPGALEGVAITGLSSGNGTWQYRPGGAGAWLDVGAVSDAAALLLGDTDWVRFVPDGQNGTLASFDFRAWDQTTGSLATRVATASRGGSTAFSDATDTASIVVTDVNDRPQLLGAATSVLGSVPEDSGAPAGAVGTRIRDLVDLTGGGGLDNAADVDTGAVTGIAVTDADTANGTWHYSIDDGSSWLPLGAVNPNSARLLAANASTRIYFQPAPDYFGSVSPGVTFRAWDQSAGINGGLGDTTPPGPTAPVSTSQGEADITVTPLNDAPSGASKTVQTDEGTPYVFQVGDFGFSDPADGHAFDRVVITTAPGAGTLRDGVTVLLGSETVSVAAIAAGDLVFTPTGDGNGPSYASFTFQVRDDGGLPGTDTDPTPNVMTIDVNAVNDPPSGSDATVLTDEDVPYVFQVGDFGFTDPIEDHGFGSVVITTAPGAGTLRDGLTLQSAGDTVSFAAVAAGDLVFTPAGDGNGPGYASFLFQVVDDGGLPGIDTDPTPNTMTIDVNAVNDAPVLDPSGSMTLTDVLENNVNPAGNSVASILSSASGDRITDVDVGAVEGIAVIGVDDSNGTWEYSTDGGTMWTSFVSRGVADGVTDDTSALLLDTSALVRFVPDAAYTGPAGDLSFRAWDVTLGASGDFGVNVIGNGGTTPYSIAKAAATLNVVGAGGVLNLVPGAQNVDEDGSLIFSAANGNSIAIDDGGAGDSTLRVTLSVTNGTLNLATAVGLIVVRGADGTASMTVVGSLAAVNNALEGLTFTPTGDYNGSANLQLTTDIADLQGHYTFDDTSDLGNDESPSGANDGVVVGPVAGVDVLPRDAVLDFTDGDFVQISGTFGNPSDVTLAAWVNLDFGEFHEEAISLGNSVALRLDQQFGDGVQGFFWNGGTWLPTSSGIFIAGTGWHHVAYSIDDAAGLQILYIDGAPVAASAYAGSISYTLGTDTLLGINPFDALANFNGSMDDARIYDRALTATEIAVLAQDTPGDFSVVDITVDPVNDAPAGMDMAVTTDEDVPYVFQLTDFVFNDPVEGHGFDGVFITTVPGAGSLRNGLTVLTGGETVSAAAIAAGDLVFTPAGDASGGPYASFRFQVMDDGGTPNGGEDLDPIANTMTIDVDPVNDSPSGVDNTVTTDEGTSYIFQTGDFGFTDPIDGHGFDSVVITSVSGGGTLRDGAMVLAGGETVSVASILANNLTFMPTGDGNRPGYASFTFQVVDDGGLPGIDTDPTPNTMTIDVSPVNDPPAGANRSVVTNEGTPYVFQLADFGFTDPADGHGFDSVFLTTAPGAGTLRDGATALAGGETVSVASILANNLTFTPTGDGNGPGYASFTFQVVDDGGLPGIDTDPAPNTMTIDVDPVNDPPAGTNRSVVTNEGTPYVFQLADFGFTDPADGHGFDSVVITTAPGAGTLRDGATALAGGETVSVASILANNLTFTPTGDGNGPGYASFTFQVVDDGGLPGIDTDPTPNTMTIDVSPVNDPPAGTNRSVVTNEGTPYVFQLADFGFTDPADGHGFDSVFLTTAPGAGTLRDGAMVLAGGETVSVASILANNLTFTPTGDGNGPDYASFTFQVVDDGGLPGIDTDPTPNTMTIDVSPVNDPPAGTDTTVVTPEDAPYVFQVGDFGFTDPIDGHGFDSVVITTAPGAGTLRNGATVLTSGDTVSVTALAAGDLVFTPAPDANGPRYASFTFQVVDDGGLPGIDTDPTPNTMTIDVSPVNDPPAGTDATVVTPEDAPVVFQVGDFGFTDPMDDHGFDSVVITTAPGAGTLRNGATVLAGGDTVSVAAIAAGDLVFTPAPDANGPRYASFTFHVVDDGGLPGVDTDPTPNTMTIDVTSVNDAPVLDDTGAMTLTNVSEDDPNPPGDSVASIVLSAGGDRITDVDAGAVEGVAVSGVDSTNGSWEYSTDGGGSWTGFGSVSDSAAVLLDASARIRFVPSPSYTGPAGEIKFRAWDQTSGANGSIGVDVSSNGGTSAFSTATESATLDVIPRNDAPVLTPAGPALTAITEDDVGNPGDDIASFLGASITDSDPGALQGIAITSLSSGNGRWESSTDGGASWSAVGSVSDGAALLLRDTDRVRFVPDGRNADAGSLTYRAWDRTTGVAGGRADASSPGGSEAFSSATDTATIAVAAVNDAPALGDAVLAAVAPDDVDPPGATIASLFAGRFSDVDAGASLGGVAVVGNGADAASEGLWQYSSDGGASWFAIGAVGDDATALVLGTGTRVRFVPATDFDGTPTALVVRALDESHGGGPSSTAGGVEVRATVDAAVRGGTSAVAGATSQISTPLGISLTQEIDPEPGPDPSSTPSPEPEPEPESEPTDPEPDGVVEPEPLIVEVVEDEPASPAGDPAPAPALLRVADVPDSPLETTASRPELYDDPSSPARASLELLRDLLIGVPDTLVEDFVFLTGGSDFLGELDELREDVEALVVFESTVVGSSIAASTGLSVGYVLWLTRGGLLLASLVSSMPAWRLIDPIPVLARLGSGETDEDDESLDSLLSGRRAPPEPDAAADADVPETEPDGGGGSDPCKS